MLRAIRLQTLRHGRGSETGTRSLSAYINSDSGTGRPRCFTVLGPPEAAVRLREVASAFADYGMVGATTTIGRRRGGSDQSVFNMHGLPGIWTSIDPIENGSHTWHTNLDTYERIVEDDAKKTAIVIAAAIYDLAMRDEMLPRFKPNELPVRPVLLVTPKPSIEHRRWVSRHHLQAFRILTKRLLQLPQSKPEYNFAK